MATYTPGPWTQERISRSLIQVSASPDALGLRESVALVNGDRMYANANAICALPAVYGSILAGDLPAARAALAEAGLA